MSDRPTEMTALDLVLTARQLIDETNRTLGLTRFLAAALLLRQALEAALDDYWAGVLPGLEDLSGRAQLITLPFYLGDNELASDVTYAWCRLSSICHHDAYELPPPPSDLNHLATIVERFLI